MQETRVNWSKKEKGGSTALRLMLRVLKKGQSVAFTADQPPGPGKQAGKGSLILAKLSDFLLSLSQQLPQERLNLIIGITLPLIFHLGEVVVFGEPIYIKKDLLKRI